MAHTDKKLVVTAMTSERLVLDIAELSIPGSVNLDSLIIETRFDDISQRRPWREEEEEEERNPLHPRALILADIRAGSRIRVHYTGLRMDIKDFSAIVTEEPFTNDEGDFIVPFMEEDGNQSQWLAADMGLAPYGENWDSPVTWTPLWCVTAEH